MKIVICQKKMTSDQVKNKRSEMSASEALCFIKDVGVLKDKLNSVGNKYRRIILLLKEIVDIATSYVVNDGLVLRLESLVYEYLSCLSALFQNYLKPKYHILVHYPTMLRLLGTSWNFSTMRCEH